MSAFAQILQALVERVPGAVGAVFADWDGEAVDVYSELPALEIKLIGAQWGVMLDQIAKALNRVALGHISSALIESANATTLVERVTDQYYVVLQLGPTSPLARAMDELVRTTQALRSEM